MVSDILKALILARKYCILSKRLRSPFFVFPIHLGMVFDYSVLYPLHKVKVGINILVENIKRWNLFFACNNEVIVKLTMMGGRADLHLNIGSELGCVWTNWALCPDSFTYEIKCTGATAFPVDHQMPNYICISVLSDFKCFSWEGKRVFSGSGWMFVLPKEASW